MRRPQRVGRATVQTSRSLYIKPFKAKEKVPRHHVLIMKKKLAVALAFAGTLLMTPNADAEIFSRPEFNSGKTIWIVRAGVSFNSVVGDWKDDTKENWEDAYSIPLTDSGFPSSIGFDVSVAFNKAIKQSPIYWGMEFGISTRGYKANAEWFRGQVSSHFGDYIGHRIRQEQTLTAYDVQLTPIMVGYKYNLLSNITIDAHLGGFVSCDFAGKLKNYDYDYQISSNKPRVKESTSKVDLGDLDGYSRLDAGLNLGIGVWYGHFNIDLTWQRGFLNMYDIDSSNQSQSLKLRVGYAF